MTIGVRELRFLSLVGQKSLAWLAFPFWVGRPLPAGGVADGSLWLNDASCAYLLPGATEECGLLH